MLTKNQPTSHNNCLIKNATQRTCQTIFGHLNYFDTETSSNKPVLLFLHGNSLCAEVFVKQFNDAQLLAKFRLIAVDLPGHGFSSHSPTSEYSFEGYANAILQLIVSLNLANIILVGHSLGGHVAMQLVAKELNKQANKRITGLVTSGSPYNTLSAKLNEQTQQPEAFYGFHPADPKVMQFMLKDTFNAEEATMFINMGGITTKLDGSPGVEPSLVQKTVNMDGSARPKMMGSITGQFKFGPDALSQREIIESANIKIVNIPATEDPCIIYQDMCARVEACNRVRASKQLPTIILKPLQTSHMTFWSSPAEFNKILLENF